MAGASPSRRGLRLRELSTASGARTSVHGIPSRGRQRWRCARAVICSPDAPCSSTASALIRRRRSAGRSACCRRWLPQQRTALLGHALDTLCTGVPHPLPPVMSDSPDQNANQAPNPYERLGIHPDASFDCRSGGPQCPPARGRRGPPGPFPGGSGLRRRADGPAQGASTGQGEHGGPQCFREGSSSRPHHRRACRCRRCPKWPFPE